MKKVFLFAVAAAALVACSNEELSTPENNLATSQAPVNFTVYTQRGLTRGGTPNDLNNENIGATGFGVFAYYTAGEGYDTKATPNFMYNQKVVSAVSPVIAGSEWTYEPVKYWPNEYGSDAISEEVDQVTFFAYAPWTEVEPTTGNIVPKSADPKFDQTHNIISVNKNTATGDPLVKYVVDTNPASSVDLLWGVASNNATTDYSAITTEGATAQLEAGLPFINLVKPNKPATDKLSFNLRHSLAKVKVTIDYIDDAETPNGPAAKQINAEETRIFVRNFRMSGFATKGALNLNNTEKDKPLWKDIDGVKDLAFEDFVFQDGRKDGKEGETNGAQSNETPQGLNPQIIENYATIIAATPGTPATQDTYTAVDAANLENGTRYYTANDGSDANGFVYDELDPTTVPAGFTTFYTKTAGSAAVAGTPAKFNVDKNLGVGYMTDAVQPNVTLDGKVAKGTVLLFGGDPSKNDGYFYVIPRNEGTGVDVEIAYDVETIDGSLSGKLSDGETHGISIENIIRKEDIFGGKDFEPGYVYEVKIHLGMTSVKVEATVQAWEATNSQDVDLPDNQITPAP